LFQSKRHCGRPGLPKRDCFHVINLSNKRMKQMRGVPALECRLSNRCSYFNRRTAYARR
jgi:hypothetical protein